MHTFVFFSFLATGDSFKTIAFSYRVGFSTVAKMVALVTRAIWEALVEDYMAVPGQAEWSEIARGFWEEWDFPNCVGAIDGKHIQIQAPPCSGSQFFNYKGSFSIVLLAVVDARKLFRVIDVGAYGRSSDGGTLKDSVFGKALQAGTLDLPPPATLPSAAHLGEVPYVFVADEAFPLKPNLMRPHAAPVEPGSPRRIFNYRLSRARLVVECAFGILAAQWRIYRRVIPLKPENVEACVKATCVLHNFIRLTQVQEGENQARRDVREPNSSMMDMAQAGGNQSSREAKRVRETLTEYLVSPAGAVAWQDNIV